MDSIADPADLASAHTEAPVVIDLGKHRRKAVKELRQGQGQLMTDISNCIRELQAAGTLSAPAQPVVVIVRQRPRKRAMWPLG